MLPQKRNKRCLFFIIAVLIAILNSTAVYSKIVDHLNVAVIPVKDYSSAQLQKAQKKAFDQVLVKVFGSNSITTLPEIRHAKRAVSRYIQSYSYLNIPKDQQSQSNRLALKVIFNQQLIDNLVKKAGGDLWDKNRPQLLIWIAIKQDNKVDLLSNNEETSLKNLITQLAFERGLPIIIPTMDIEDIDLSKEILSIKLDDFLDPQLLQKFGNRYHADLVLAGYFEPTLSKKEWGSQWQLASLSKNYQWSIKEKKVESIIQAAINNSINTITQQATALDDFREEERIILQINPVESLQTYQALVKFINSLNFVKSLSLKSMQKDTITFDVQIKSNKEMLKKALIKDNHLNFLAQDSMPIAHTTSDTTIKNIIPILYYQYHGDTKDADTALS